MAVVQQVWFFRYEVVQTDLDTDGIEMTNSIDLGLGTSLKDEMGNLVSPLTFTAPSNLSDVLVKGGGPNVILSLTELSVGENGGTGTYTVRLNSEPTHPVTVALRSADTSVATVSPSSLTFEVNNDNNKIWSAPQTVTVTGVNDDIDNDVGGSTRTVNITHSVTSSDTDYNNITVNPVEVTSNDDDDVGSIKLTVSQTNVNEGATVRTLSIRAQFEGSTSGGQSNTSVRLSDDLSLSISVVAVTAQVGDFDPVPDFNMDISAGDDRVTESFSLGIVDDGVDENDETFEVRGASSLSLTISPATITIVDDDEKGVIVSRSSLSVSENGGMQTYTVRLESEPMGPVIIFVTSSDTGIATVSPTLLTFEANNDNGQMWSTPRTVTVTGVNDSSSTNSRQTTITHTVSGEDYSGETVADVSVTSIDITLGLTVANATEILSDNYESYSISGTCSPSGGDVSVQVGSMSAMSVSCTSGTWTKEGIDTSSDITSNGSVTITATQVVNLNNLTASIDVQRCVSSGDGTSVSSPKLICSYEEFKTVMKNITDYDYVALDIDIDAKSSWSEGDANCGAYDGTHIAVTDPCSGWTPVHVVSYDGVFDGKGHTVENLYIHSSKDYLGLFGVLTINKISNLHFRNVHIHSTGDQTYMGTISGLLSNGDIDGCSVTGKLSSDYRSFSGGLVGNTLGKILNSYTDVQMTIEEGTGSKVGGLAGLLTSGFVMSSYSVGSVKINSSSGGTVGGLVGVVSGDDSWFDSSYSHTEVSGGDNSGGLVGMFSLTASNTASISHSYSLGDGFPADPLFNDNSDISSNSDLFWDTDISGISTSGATGSTGLTTANMQVACSNGTTTGICALGGGFSFTAGEYPKVKKCSTCDPASPVFGDVLEGQ